MGDAGDSPPTSSGGGAYRSRSALACSSPGQVMYARLPWPPLPPRSPSWCRADADLLAFQLLLFGNPVVHDRDHVANVQVPVGDPIFRAAGRDRDTALPALPAILAAFFIRFVQELLNGPDPVRCHQVQNS